MRSVARICMLLWITVLTCWGCAGSKDAFNKIPTTINTVDTASGLSKKIAVAFTHTPPSAIGRQIGDLYFKSLIEAMRAEGPRLHLVTRQDSDWPDAMNEMAQDEASPGHSLVLAQKIRSLGFNAWATARIETIWPVSRKTGILWFRKDRYFIYVEAIVAVYDPFTGAKILNSVVETSAKVGEDEYDAFKNGETVDIDNLNEAIADVAADLGKQAAKALNAHPWQTGVVAIEGDRILLSADAQSGLQAGDRLAVFEGRRILEGQGGERFIVPGPKVADLEIVRVTGQLSEAKDLSDSGATKIQVGDIAVAVK